MRSIYRDLAYGFSIEPPEPIDSQTEAVAGPIQRVRMLFPPEQGVSSNMNVVILPQKTTRDVYVELSKREFEAQGATLLSEERRTVTGRDAVVLEYQIGPAGSELHFLALSVFETERVLLVTCAAPKATFAKYEASFRKSLASFSLEPRAFDQ